MCGIFLLAIFAVKRNIRYYIPSSVLVRLEMARLAKKTDKAKKSSQVEGGGRVEDSAVTDPPNDRNVILTDGNNPDA